MRPYSQYGLLVNYLVCSLQFLLGREQASRSFIFPAVIWDHGRKLSLRTHPLLLKVQGFTPTHSFSGMSRYEGFVGVMASHPHTPFGVQGFAPTHSF